MNDEKNDYEVGYKRPPIATRFKKGQSGNPSGKPKKISQELDPGKILQSIDNATPLEFSTWQMAHYFLRGGFDVN
jgi:Family of unknown function (DUF5681)